MAEVNFYDPMDYRDISFSIDGYDEVWVKSDWVVHDVTYPSVFYVIDQLDNGQFISFDLYGTGFTFSGDSFTGGTVQAIYLWFKSLDDGEWYYNYEVRGLNISATELQAVGASISETDDQALLQKIFAKADRINLSDGDDFFSGFGGHDVIKGNGGNDTLLGAFGNDKVYGGAGADELWGGAGMDTLNGGAGRDMLYGGKDADVFVFKGKFSVDTVADFQNGIDHLDFGGAAVTVSQHGEDTWLQVGTNKVILVNVDADLISDADYILA